MPCGVFEIRLYEIYSKLSVFNSLATETYAQVYALHQIVIFIFWCRHPPNYQLFLACKFIEFWELAQPTAKQLQFKLIIRGVFYF